MRDTPLVLIGGWGLPVEAIAGLHQGWKGPVFRFSTYDFHTVDETPERLVGRWLARTPPGAIWAGWSLGGQLAMLAASLAPHHVGGVFTCCSAPRFVEAPDWPVGMPGQEFEAFRDGLARDPSRFWKRFLHLQIQGDLRQGEARKALRPWLQSGLPADNARLLRGLDWLASLDQRTQWLDLPLPHRHCYGEHDSLVDASIVREFAAGEMEVVAGMGHWPFGAYSRHIGQRLEGFRDGVETHSVAVSA